MQELAVSMKLPLEGYACYIIGREGGKENVFEKDKGQDKEGC